AKAGPDAASTRRANGRQSNSVRPPHPRIPRTASAEIPGWTPNLRKGVTTLPWRGEIQENPGRLTILLSPKASTVAIFTRILESRRRAPVLAPVGVSRRSRAHAHHRGRTSGVRTRSDQVKSGLARARDVKLGRQVGPASRGQEGQAGTRD